MSCLSVNVGTSDRSSEEERIYFEDESVVDALQVQEAGRKFFFVRSMTSGEQESG